MSELPTVKCTIERYQEMSGAVDVQLRFVCPYCRQRHRMYLHLESLPKVFRARCHKKEQLLLADPYHKHIIAPENRILSDVEVERLRALRLRDRKQFLTEITRLPEQALYEVLPPHCTSCVNPWVIDCN
jgi:hypothetical protein